MKNCRSVSVRKRVGLALPLVLACMVVAMMIGAALIRSVLLCHRHARLHEQQVQSMWLADSALQRAVHQLRVSPEYRGEVWEVTPEELGNNEDALVTIKVESNEQGESEWKIRVEAIYPNDAQHRVMQCRELSVQLER